MRGGRVEGRRPPVVRCPHIGLRTEPTATTPPPTLTKVVGPSQIQPNGPRGQLPERVELAKQHFTSKEGHNKSNRPRGHVGGLRSSKHPGANDSGRGKRHDGGRKKTDMSSQVIFGGQVCGGATLCWSSRAALSTWPAEAAKCRAVEPPAGTYSKEGIVCLVGSSPPPVVCPTALDVGSR